jgi:hypothetical protein
VLSIYPPRVIIPERKGNRAVILNVSTGESSYDVFLSYNSADHGVVEDIARSRLGSFDRSVEPRIACHLYNNSFAAYGEALEVDIRGI